MLFIKHTYESGKTRLFPIKNDNVLVLCDYCGEMMPVPDPAGFIYESGACGSSIEAPELCDRCREMKNRMEEIIYAWNHTYTIRESSFLPYAIDAIHKHLYNKYALCPLVVEDRGGKTYGKKGVYHQGRCFDRLQGKGRQRHYSE